MPVGTARQDPAQPRFDTRPSPAVPPAPGHLLRPGDGGRRGAPARHRHAAAGTLAAAAVVLLAADPARTGGGRRATSSFGRRVEAVRSQLAPIDRVAVLARAFGQEAFQWLPDHPTTGARGGSADAVRIAYAIRWIELRSDLAMPPWPWHPDRAPGAR